VRKRGAVIGVGTVLLVIGLGGLTLLQTGVIYPPGSSQLVNSTEARSPVPVPKSAQPLQSAVQAPSSLEARRAVPAPQSGAGERRYPAQDRLEQLRKSLKASEGSGVEGQSARKTDSKSYAQKAQNKHQARKTHAKSNTSTKKSKSLARDAHPGKKQARKGQSKSYANGKSKSLASKAYRASGMKPVVVEFKFDPVRDRELYVARVHAGDKIKVNVKRVGNANGRVYLAYSKNPDSKEGALVKVGARSPTNRSAGYRPGEHGYYVIEMKIYTGKRWNIKPRSFV
jgi:hypothetical protein